VREFVHKCGELGCPYFEQPSPKNCGCHNTDYQMMNTELTALRARVAQLEGALEKAKDMANCKATDDLPNLVTRCAGVLLIARQALGGSDGRA
jgi:hypothetical protein